MLAIPDQPIVTEAAAEPKPEPGPFQDIPKSIWVVFLSAWGLLFSMFVVFFTVNPEASFVITIAASFVLMAFGLPLALAAQGRCEGHKCGEFVQTHTGPLSVRAAGAQIAAVPVCALIGLSAFIMIAM